MSLLLAILAQAATASPPERIDLTVRPPCEVEAEIATEAKIVVCAERDRSDYYRFNRSEPKPADRIKAETQLADGVAIAAETEQDNIGGVPVNRLMMRLKLKF